MKGRRASRGFTLIEIMVVLVILAGIVSIVGVNVFATGEDANYRIARTQMIELSNVIRMYRLRHHAVPSALEDLRKVDVRTGEPLMERVPEDPWRHAYEYCLLEGRHYRILCLGKDAVEGTPDDLVWPGEADSRPSGARPAGGNLPRGDVSWRVVGRSGVQAMCGPPGPEGRRP